MRKKANDFAPLGDGPLGASWFLYGREGFPTTKRQTDHQKAHMVFGPFEAAEVALDLETMLQIFKFSFTEEAITERKTDDPNVFDRRILDHCLCGDKIRATRARKLPANR